MEFKDYKEKQKHYKELAKRYIVKWISKEGGHKNSIIKGRTYVKPKEEKNDK